MPKGFLPNSDAFLLAWASNFAQKINVPGVDYGLTIEQCEQFQADTDSYADAYRIASDLATRTRGSVASKNFRREKLKNNARALAAIVQAHPPVTDDQRISLGLSVRSKKPSPIARPQFAPTLHVLSVSGHRIRIRLKDSQVSGTRRKPRNVIGATVLLCVAAKEPSSLSDWRFAANTTKTKLNIHLPTDVPSGARVWLCAWWRNARLQRGPICTPIATNIQGGPSAAIPMALAA
jgi:hypothetical protein